MKIEAFGQSMGLEGSQYVELLELFVETSARDLDTLEAAVADNRPEAARDAAHSLKGAALSMGLELFSAQAAEIEQRAADNALDGILGELRSLRQRLVSLQDQVPR